MDHTPVKRSEFIEMMDEYPIFRSKMDGHSVQKKYQYSSKNIHYLDNVLDMVTYQGFGMGYHYWILNKYCKK